MEVILKTDIQGLGYKNDIVSVKDGYARNYLIPQSFAIIANKSNTKMAEENIKQAAHKAEKIKTAAEEIAKTIGELTLEIKVKAGESGKIFGAVTTLQVSDGLKAKDVDVDRKKIAFKSVIKELGEYEAILDLHKEVKHNIKLSIVAE